MSGLPPAGELVTADQLRAWLDFEQDAKVEKWLREHRIRYFYGKRGRPVTTTTAINTALLERGDHEEVRF